MKLVIVNGTIKGENCTIGTLPDVKKEILARNSLSTLSFPQTFQHSYEVALLRVFHYESWHVSTARKLNAFHSFWASETSFGAYFEQIVGPLDPFFETLDPGTVYFFLIPLHDNQRLGTILPAPKNTFWLAATQDRATGKMDLDPAAAPAPCQTLPKITVQSADELLEYAAKINDPHLTGFMLVRPEGMIRFVTEEYMYRFQLRGNEPNILKKYVELVKAGCDDDIEIFCEQHPAPLQAFDREMNKFVQYLHSKYIERYVKKQYILFPKLIHAILKQCHALYLSDRTEKITRERIAKVVLGFPALFILNALAQQKQPHSDTDDFAPPPGKKRPARPAASEPSPGPQVMSTSPRS